MYDMSGSFVFRSGVGTQMLMVSSVLTTEKSVVASSLPDASQRLDVLRRDVRYVGLAAVDSPRLPIVEIDPGDSEADFGEFNCQRQTDVSKADDPDMGLSALDFPQQIARDLIHAQLLLGQQDIRSGSHGRAPGEEPEQSSPEVSSLSLVMDVLSGFARLMTADDREPGVAADLGD